MSNKDTVKIAIVDSGVNSNYSKEFLRNKLIGGITILENDKGEFIEIQNYEDEYGHGTATVSIIDNNVSNVEFYIVKILDKNGRCSKRLLINALEHLLKIDIDIINLSLSSERKNNELIKVCKQLIFQNKIIIASKNNRDILSFPAEFEKVIGVCAGAFKENFEYWYYEDYPIQCVANGIPCLCLGEDNRYFMFGGSSKATALFTAYIAGLIQKNNMRSIEGIKHIIKKNSKRKSWNKSEIPYFICRELSEVEKSKIYELDIDKIIKKIISDYFNLSNNINKLLKIKNFDEIGIRFKNEDYINIVKKIEREFGICINKMSINILDFQNIYTIGYLVYRQIVNNRKE